MGYYSRLREERFSKEELTEIASFAHELHQEHESTYSEKDIIEILKKSGIPPEFAREYLLKFQKDKEDRESFKSLRFFVSIVGGCVLGITTLFLHHNRTLHYWFNPLFPELFPVAHVPEDAHYVKKIRPWAFRNNFEGYTVTTATLYWEGKSGREIKLICLLPPEKLNSIRAITVGEKVTVSKNKGYYCDPIYDPE